MKVYSVEMRGTGEQFPLTLSFVSKSFPFKVGTITAPLGGFSFSLKQLQSLQKCIDTALDIEKDRIVNNLAHSIERGEQFWETRKELYPSRAEDIIALTVHEIPYPVI